MKITSTRRLAAAIIAPALAVGTLLAAPSAQAATPAEDSAATWLVEQPKIDGLFTSYFGPTRGDSFVDYGLNLDLAVALDELGEAPAAEKVYDAVVAGADAYTDAFGTRYAGAMGKLAVNVQLRGDDATDVGGRDLIAQTEAIIETDGDRLGRATDHVLATGDVVQDFESSNSIGQGFVVRALDAASSPLADETLAYLLKQQCDDGSFRVVLADTQCTTGTGTVDGTAFAAQTLRAVGDQADALEDALDYLVAAQQPDGSFQDDGKSNANSTGLAAVALDDLGAQGAAQHAAGWVADHQVASGDEEGAIALDDADLAAAKAAPIARIDRDRYVRTSVQAALALRAVDTDVATVAVTAPTGYVSGGTSITVTATGLKPGEPFTARVGSAARVFGTADASGEVSASVPTPGGTATRTVTVQGTNATRAGQTTVKVLGAKVLSLKVNAASVKKGKSQIIKVSGLVANEPMTIRLSGTVLKTVNAYSDGTYTYSFKVGSSAGKKTIKVTGRFANRTVSKTFRVS